MIPTINGAVDIRTLIMFGVVAIVSLTLHEFAHAWVAVRNGDITPQVQGRLTLNPRSHIDPIGFVALIIAGFGFAKPVEVNPLNFRNRRLGSFCVAIAGVTVNFALMIVSVFLATLCQKMAFDSYGSAFDIWVFFFEFFSILATVNIFLVFFNLLPIAPLDGFRLISSLTRASNKFVQFMQEYGSYILVFLILASIVVNRVPQMPSYFDLLGTYLQFFGGNVLQFFAAIFRLVFYGEWVFVYITPW
ncbi:MAG: site-2 protease family protein [Clostridiales bacterium]|jgi:Zn-dependent protease|nr:site-2 protease family protein [Clostridiales bacterium]